MFSEKQRFTSTGPNTKVSLDSKSARKCISTELNCSTVDSMVLILKMISIFKTEANERVLKCIIQTYFI